ncbi:MAG: Bax inhibitor-1/YccA family protein [Spirochaetota bacterium]
MRSSNPALSERVFSENRGIAATSDRMTIDGTINKTFLLFLFALVPAGFVWEQFYTGGIESITTYMIIGVIGSFIMALLTIFMPHLAGYTAPIYAALEGLSLGGISAYMNSLYGGIVIQAVGLTFGIMFAMLVLYKTGTIKVTDKLRSIVMMGAFAIILMYLVTWIAGIFLPGVAYIHGNGAIGIGFSLLVIGIASFFLLLDFDFIERGAQSGAPKYMEWYGAFSLMVTLVWLYLELLNLLRKLNSD